MRFTDTNAKAATQRSDMAPSSCVQPVGCAANDLTFDFNGRNGFTLGALPLRSAGLTLTQQRLSMRRRCHLRRAELGWQREA